MQMLRHTMALDYYLNVTDFLGIEGGPQDESVVKEKMERLKADEMTRMLEDSKAAMKKQMARAEAVQARLHAADDRH